MFDPQWWESALDASADIYLAATPDRRDRVAAAVEALNRRLRSDPFDAGESRHGG